MADTGWVTGDSGSIDRDGKQAWANGDNPETQNDTYASVCVPKEDYSDWIRMWDFGFDVIIPAGSTITGIEVRIDKHGSETLIKDSSVRLVLDGVSGGDDKASATIWPNTDTDTYVTYGGPGDMWSTAYDLTDVSDFHFGWQISAYNEDITVCKNAYIDHMQMKIYYTEPVYGNKVNGVPSANIGSVNDVPTTDIETINEV
ncbi:MAG: hypothetical protein ACXADY_20780 [Candidatus Hodarchaeales archaeon]|jgi:hypothetical protein